MNDAKSVVGKRCCKKQQHYKPASGGDASVLVLSVYLWHVSFESDFVGTELMVQARRAQGVFHIFVVIQDVP